MIATRQLIVSPEEARSDRLARRLGIPTAREWAIACERQDVALSRAVQATRRVRMADGPYYLDSRAPWITADITAATLATTATALYPKDNFPVLGGQYFNYIGKGLLIRMFGRMTSGATPGNFSWNVFYGSGASNTGTSLQTSSAVAWTASQTNTTWQVEVEVRCRSIGSTGTLFCTGWSIFNNAAIASTLQPLMIPATAPAVSGSVDLTSANIISVQALRSGSTAETMQIHQMTVIALN